MKVATFQEHADRTSVSFADRLGDVDAIVTVTFDPRAIQKLTPLDVLEKAREELRDTLIALQCRDVMIR